MVFVLSWNVAGWLRTIGQIKANHGSADNYFEKLGSPGVICLQEVKIDDAKLSKLQAADVGPSVCLHGKDCSDESCETKWMSFWSISRIRKGYSGVTTFARRGLVLRATSKVFQNPKFDDEGRCVATLLNLSGDLVNHPCSQRVLLVNVYVPYGGSSEERMDYKHEFLRCLSEAIRGLMITWEASECIFVGDMNVSLWEVDIHWLYRTFPADCRPHSSMVDHNRHDVEFLTKLRRLFAAHEGLIDFEGVQKTARQKGIHPKLFQSFAEEHGILPLWKVFCAKLFHSLYCGDDVLKLIDTFSFCHPGARDRFTCWDQSRNKRFVNVGTRIDYIFVTDGLKHYLYNGPVECSYTEAESPQVNVAEVNDTSRKGPLADATANGRWRPSTDPMREFASSEIAHQHQFERTKYPHTGMVYTPPQYSDHIAVSLKLCFPTENGVTVAPKQLQSTKRTGGAEHDSETLQCMFTPTKQVTTQRDISSFFKRKTS